MTHVTTATAVFALVVTASAFAKIAPLTSRPATQPQTPLAAPQVPPPASKLAAPQPVSFPADAKIGFNFQEKALPIVEEVRKEKGLCAIFNLQSSGVVASHSGLELSAEVVKRLDAKYPGGGSLRVRQRESIFRIPSRRSPC